MRYFTVILLLLLSIQSCYARHMFKEEVYQAYWCGKHNGIMEYKLNDKTRVDCLTEQYAAEVDFAPKWAECIGQSLYYGQKTKRYPVCVLILEKGEKDLKYLRRLRYTAYKKGVRTFTLTPDKLHKFMIKEVEREIQSDIK